MLVQEDEEIDMHVMKAEAQIKIQGRFCYVENQLCCYTVIFLEPRFIFCKQYKYHGLWDCLYNTEIITDHKLLFSTLNVQDS